MDKDNSKKEEWINYIQTKIDTYQNLHQKFNSNYNTNLSIIFLILIDTIFIQITYSVNRFIAIIPFIFLNIIFFIFLYKNRKITEKLKYSGIRSDMYSNLMKDIIKKDYSSKLIKKILYILENTNVTKKGFTIQGISPKKLKEEYKEALKIAFELHPNHPKLKYLDDEEKPDIYYRLVE